MTSSMSGDLSVSWDKSYRRTPAKSTHAISGRWVSWRRRMEYRPAVPTIQPGDAAFGSVCQRLCTAEVGDQIADLLIGETVQQTFRHKRHAGGFQFGNVRLLQCDVLAVGSTQDEQPCIALDQKARKAPVILGLHEKV